METSDPTPFSNSLAYARRENRMEPRAEIIEQFRPYLRTLATQVLNEQYLARISISDLVQSAIFGALQDFSQCRATNEAEFKGWLRRLLINDIMNKVRFVKQEKRDLRKEVPLSDIGKIADRSDSTATMMIRKEEEARLNSALEKLSEEDQSVIRMRNQEKLKFNEIGEQMGRSEDSARMLWIRAVQRLSRFIEK